MIFVLDAGPMIAFLKAETGGNIVMDILDENRGSCHAHAMNVAEVYYILARRNGVQAAELAVTDILAADIVIHEDFDTEFWKDAASIKASHPLALPDAICVASRPKNDGIYS